MFDEALRPLKNSLMVPLARLISFLSPSQISVVGLLVALIMFGALLQGQFVAAAILWIVNRIFDGLDGIVAREYGRQSDVGGYIDILCDYVAYTLLPIGVMLGQPFDMLNWIALIFLLATFYVNSASWMFLAAILEKRNRGSTARGETTTITMPRGFVAGFETIVFFTLFALFPQVSVYLYFLMGGMIIFGMIYRLNWANKNLT